MSETAFDVDVDPGDGRRWGGLVRALVAALFAASFLDIVASPALAEAPPPVVVASTTPPPDASDGGARFARPGSDDAVPAWASPDDATSEAGRGDALLATPVEVNDSVRVTKDVSQTATISWTDSPGPFNVYRGSIPAGTGWAYNQSCFGTSLPVTSLTDSETPTTGSLFYYLVSRLSGCEESPLGRDSAAEPIPASGLCFSPGTGLLPAKAYFMVAFDTSGSMTSSVGAPNSCGYPTDRLGHGRCALKNMIQAFSGQVNFGLATYAFRMSGCTPSCYSGCTYGPFPGDATQGCGPEPNPGDPNSASRQGANIVVPLQQDNFWDPVPAPSNAATMLSWADNVCTANVEVFANGLTPLNGVLRDMHRYLSNQWTSPLGNPTYVSPLGAAGQDRACRSVNVLLITDGDESCDSQANAVNAAQALLTGFMRGGITWHVKTYVINFAGGNQASTDQIAAAGGTGASFFATNETQLSQALAAIVGGAAVRESCDNGDNNCNGCIDEGYRHFRDVQAGPGLCCAWNTLVERAICLANYRNSITPVQPLGNRSLLPCTTADQQNDSSRWLCYDPGENCDGLDNNGDGIADEGLTRCGTPLHCPTAEVCNGQDDNCNGSADEGGVCPGGCVARPEACNGCDDDCDGQTDDGVAPVACGQAQPSNCQGIQTCKPPQSVSPGGCAPGGGWNPCGNSPAAETCDGLDNDCNGAVDDSLSCPCAQRQELCNGIDDNCNVQIDEGVTPPSPAQVCGVSPAATRPECTNGVAVSCVGGAWQCTFPAGVCNSGGCGGTAESCDALDNNCDGRLNENAPDHGRPCNSDDGLPQPGHGRCRTSGSFVCTSSSTTACSAVMASCATLPGGCEETCDGVDNDCDGLTDEPYTNRGPNAPFFVKPAVTRTAASLWEYTYEASRPSADVSFPGYGNGYFTSAPAGVPLERTIACSAPSRIPWFTVTPAEAEQVCQAAGGVLCSLNDWTTGCQATVPCIYGYSPRGSACISTFGPTKYCNLGPSYDFNPSVVGDQDGLIATASSALRFCASDWTGLQGNAPPDDKLYDITGNLREFAKVAPNQYAVKGGAFNNALDSGSTCLFNFYQVDSTYSGFDAGFRCCFTTDPRQ